MSNSMIRSISMLGISVMMALSVAAQDVPKVKITDKETKYKSEDLKTKDEKGKESKYKSGDVKIKVKKDELKYKSDVLKVKDDKDERKIKATVKPMRATKTERTVLKKGETNVKTTEHIVPLNVEPAVTEPVVAEQPTMREIPAAPKKAVTRKYVTKKSNQHKAVNTRKNNTARKYIVRTKIVRDTVYVASPPERVVSTQTEYVHDTVTVTRVDTVVKVQKVNTYTGYQVPRGNFKKVKLKKDKDGDEVRMKRK